MSQTAPSPASKRPAVPYGRRLAALALAVAVPAFAAPSEWHGLTGWKEARAEAVTPMGFETAGESFPGSAFYYLADEPYLPLEARDGDGTLPVADVSDTAGRAGPAARPLIAGGSQLDQARALQCLSMAVYYEAATESDAGQRAVAQVVLNRVAHPSYPNSVCGVVFQGSERETGCQFSFTCDGSLDRKPSPAFWDRARQVAAGALDGAVYRPVGLATHYHTLQIHPYWADSLHSIGAIGAHRFYRWKGVAGESAAFSARYAANEPLPARHTARAGDQTDSADPVRLARLYEETHPPAAAAQQADRAGAQASAPVAAPAYTAAVEERGGEALYSGSRLPGAGEVKAQYANSGQWIARP